MAHHLGERQAIYKKSMGCAITLLIASFLAFITPFYEFLVDPTSFSTAPITITIFFVGAALLFGVAVPYVRDLNSYVFVYEHGLLYLHSAATRIIRWDQITFVWRLDKARCSYRLQCQDDSTLQLQNFSNMEILGKTIEKETVRLQIPSIRDAFALGRPIAFGELLVQPSGLNWQGNRLSWHELQRIQIRKGYNGASDRITIQKHGLWVSWATITIGAVPNIEVLKILISPYVEMQD